VALQWKVFWSNAAVLIAATLLLVLSPVTVSFPVALAELVAVAGGLAVMMLVDLALLRRAFGPLTRLADIMGKVDPLRPGERAAVATRDREVVELAAAFNGMLGRLETERRDSARRALAAEEGERIRLARELHDGVGQALTAVVLELGQVSRRVEPALADEVGAARDAVRACLEEVRTIARGLRPEALDDLGLPSALASLGNTIERQTGLRVARKIAPALPALSSEEELVVYRVAQEALTNVVRHARTGCARLELGVLGGCVVLAVGDRGVGFDAGKAAGGGLTGMRERALLVGATLGVVSAPGGGTTVTLSLPAPDREVAP
jgi:two-component system sensor histidine kinase UhpB